MGNNQIKNKTKLRWLHLTDLHFGSKNEAQSTAIGSLVNAIITESDDTPFDLIFITGDLAYSGKKEEYEKLANELISPLRDSDLFGTAKIIATPGNHDLNCDIGYPPAWSMLGPSRQTSFFNLDESGRKTRNGRAQAFTAYRDFLSQHGITGVDPTLEPAHIEKINVNGQEFAIISVVTAYFSDREVSDYQKSPAPTHPIRTILQGIGQEIPKIVVGHHPLSWFTSDSEKQLRTLLAEQNALYLNGHEHEIKTLFGGRGLQALGFGAAFQGSLDTSSHGHYRNSFAICEYDDFLHVKIVSWDYEHGAWRIDQNLPFDFNAPSDTLRGGHSLVLPTTRISSTISRPLANLAASVKVDTEFEQCVWIANNPQKRWLDILVKTGHVRNAAESYTLPSQSLATGHSQFRLRDQRGNHLVHAVSGAGDVLSYEQLQAINTELDRQSYDTCIITTFGKLADEARTLATQLKSKKAITTLEQDQITKSLLRTLSKELKTLIANIDTTESKASLVIADSGIFLLLQERSSTLWFCLFNEQGLPFNESDEAVIQVRNALPELQSVRFRAPTSTQLELSLPGSNETTFDKAVYLAESYKHFDDVKYAPLAALGFKFRKASLSEIYVDASADVTGNNKNSQSLNRAISEFVDTLSLPKQQRDQLESQLRARHGVDRTAEVGAARLLYQRFNNAVVLGDPGSGKTCFVKHEILAYCKPPIDGGSWYKNHLPVYVSLAEAARLLDPQTDLLDICEILSARRGANLPKVEIQRGLAEGRIAFFFDGLDEVGFIDKRILLLSEIEKLVKTHAQNGSRFVIASRPAAIQPVQIPDGLTYLHLKGLSEEEMRILAGRVLTIRLGDDEESELTSEESDLINKLIEDTKHNPGIARIARNPLLLTLLVLIYANTGAISAKRHMIYTQAIKTLVSVRGRQTREQQISEADLRTRLGAVAVAIFSREVAEIPRRSEVLKIVSPLFKNVSLTPDLQESANSFLQEVAEATGLLSIHESSSSKVDDLITFMHYSFLEYYAAAGLLSKLEYKNLSALARNPRWKDVITLLFGILSEQADITPEITKVLDQTEQAEGITEYRLLLALECAAECDVPPIATQQLLADAVFSSITNGAGRYCSKSRDAIAGRVSHFLQTASARFELSIISGLKSPDPGVAAAFVDFIAQLPDETHLPTEICNAFDECLNNSHPVLTASCMYAIERRPELRVQNVLPALKRALKGSLIEKHAGLRVLSFAPNYYDDTSALVRQLLNDGNEYISSTAARCILGSSIGFSRWSESPSFQESLLSKLSFSDEDGGPSLPGITLDEQQIERMLHSSSRNECELAIRFLPLLKNNPSFIYQTLISTLKGSADPRHKAACLDSLRATPQAMNLITIADTDLICSCLFETERNVRISAVRLLGDMPDDEQVVRSLEEFFRGLQDSRNRDPEISATAKALAKHARRSPRLRAQVLEMVSSYLPKTPESGFGDSNSQGHLVALLTVCESLGVDHNDSLARRLLTLAESYKTPEAIRKHSLQVYGRLVEPTIQSAEVFIRLLGKSDPRLNESIYTSTCSFITRCKKRVEFVRRVHPKLPQIRDQLTAAWSRETPSNPESIDISSAREIRDALIGVDELMFLYSEFSERASPGTLTS